MVELMLTGGLLMAGHPPFYLLTELGDLSIVFEVFKAFGPIGVLVFLWWKERAEKDDLKKLVEKVTDIAAGYEKKTSEATTAIYTAAFVNGQTLESVANIKRHLENLVRNHGHGFSACPLADLAKKADIANEEGR